MGKGKRIRRFRKTTSSVTGTTTVVADYPFVVDTVTASTLGAPAGRRPGPDLLGRHVR